MIPPLGSEGETSAGKSEGAGQEYILYFSDGSGQEKAHHVQVAFSPSRLHPLPPPTASILSPLPEFREQIKPVYHAPKEQPATFETEIQEMFGAHEMPTEGPSSVGIKNFALQNSSQPLYGALPPSFNKNCETQLSECHTSAFQIGNYIHDVAEFGMTNDATLLGTADQKEIFSPPKGPSHHQVERKTIKVGGKSVLHFDLEDIEPYFGMPLESAAQKLGVCSTVLKKISRKHGIQRWPYRKVRSEARKIAKLGKRAKRNGSPRVQQQLDSTSTEGYDFD